MAGKSFLAARLIAFSNHHFYDDDLVTFPSPDDLDGSVRACPRGSLAVQTGIQSPRSPSRRRSDGTFVNRRRVVAVELRAGDLLQIGPFAWSFSAVDGQLVPLAPVAGVGLQLVDLHVTGRLGPQFNLTIEPDYSSRKTRKTRK